MASSILVTDSFGLISGVSREIQKQLPMLSTKYNRESLKNNGAYMVDSLNQAVDIANDLAPEHLELAVQNPFEILGDISKMPVQYFR